MPGKVDTMLSHRHLLFLFLLSLSAACAKPTLPKVPLPEATVPAAPMRPTENEGPQPSSLTSEPVVVTYLTPGQIEGPYYPVVKPADRDNDLVALAGASGLPVGEILEFGGRVYDAAGIPVAGAVVEIWQTDANGIYFHPDDAGTAGRDPNFQFYGEAVTTADGGYRFRTVLPGPYEPRPRHIHVKVKLDGEEVLTTQFYFAGEIDLQGDEAALLIDAQPGQDAAGNPILTGERDIVLGLGVGP